MDFKDQIKLLADKVAKMKEHIQTEEATKNAFIMPFIQTMGYDVFNPMEVVPEYVADLGIKKGEKVDYAILKDGTPIILIECKHWSADLDPHNSQLFRYFHVSRAKFGILTNGINFRFYTDLVEANKMDEKPFFEFKVDDMKDVQIEKLKEFTKLNFNLESINNTASELKYMSELRSLIVKEMNDPSDDFVRYFAKTVYPSIVTPKVLEQFKAYVKRTFAQYQSDAISDRLKSALINETAASEAKVEIENTQVTEESKVVTTEEEMETFYIIRAILRSIVDVNRVAHRDTQSYFGILLDDNNRKPICRLSVSSKRKVLSLFDQGKEDRIEIADINAIYSYSDRIIQTVKNYDNPNSSNSLLPENA